MKIEALKYNNRTDFTQKSNWAYKVAVKLGILDEICVHMEVLWEKKWHNPEIVLMEALKYRTRRDFIKTNGGAYNAARRLGILEEVCRHMKPKATTLTPKEIAEEAIKYSGRFEFQKRSHRAYMSAVRLDILEQVCAHMEPINMDWTKEAIYKEMSKHSSRNEFMRKSKNAYNAALRLDMLGEIDSILGREKEHCTVERIFDVAKKYKYRSKFQRANPYIHRVAVKLGVLDEACKHMKRVGSIMEQELTDEIRKILPLVRKYVDKKVKISGKPYIKNLEIDIFSKEGMRGIEFDGTYYHSFEGLKKSHPTWPDEDLLIYHEIKDSYFLSRGIKILHIKEVDWKENREECIKRAIAFLS